MSPSQQSEQGQTPANSLVEFLVILTKHRKFISRFVLGTTVVVTVITLLMPKWYKSSSSIFPAPKTDLLGALGGFSSLVGSFSPGNALAALGGNPEADRYIAILKSGTVLGAVIRKFDLVNVYEITSYPQEKTAAELVSNTEFTAEIEGNITVTVYDKDPQRAADMANYFVEMLNKTDQEMQVQNARANREFIEQRYNKNLADLAVAEDSLKGFQQRYGIIALPEQTEASIKAAAEISGQLALKEVEVGVLSQMFTPDHPSVLQAKLETGELRKKVSQMSTGGLRKDGELNVFVPFKKVPELGSQYVRKFREVEIQSKILEFVTPLYEQAKVEEKRHTPSVVVLDRAGPAERKAKPKVTLYALLALVISTLVSLLVVFTREMLEKLRAAHGDRVDGITSALRSDWFGLRIRRKSR